MGVAKGEEMKRLVITLMIFVTIILLSAIGYHLAGFDLTQRGEALGNWYISTIFVDFILTAVAQIFIGEMR